MTKFKIISIMLCSIILLTSCSNTASNPSDTEKNIETAETPLVDETTTYAVDGVTKYYGLAGSSVSDVQTAFNNKFNMPISSSRSPSMIDSFEHEIKSSVINTSSKDEIYYSIRYDKNDQINQASFMLSNFNASNTDFLMSSAIECLGFASTIIYDTSNTDLAKKFVSDNIPNLINMSEMSTSTTIGDANFLLSAMENNGSIVAYTLMITKL